MRSFASIAAFATLAFSALTSAIPLDGAKLPELNAAPQVRGYADVSERATAALSAAAEVDVAAQRRGDVYHSIPEVLVSLNDKVVPLCHELTAKVEASVSAEVALEVSLEILGQVKDLVFTAKADIEALVYANVEGILTLQGKVLSVSAIAQILATLVIAITAAVDVVVKVCVAVDIKLLLSLIVEISGCVAAIIAIVLQLSAGVLVELQALIKVAVDVIISLHLEALIKVLQIAVNVQA